MKLYFAPGACSLGIHVIFEEIGKPYEMQAVNLRAGDHFKPEFLAINPKAKVPAVLLDHGEILTEWLAIAGYLAATNPQAKLTPADPLAAARVTEIMVYINSFMHGQGFARMFRPERFAPEADEAMLNKVRAEGLRLFSEGFALIDQALAGRDYLLGDFSIADAALFYVSYWAEGRKTCALPPHVAAHYARMLARPAVQRAMAAEGLV
ncbi:glutathione S-transferase [Acidiphilium sp. MT5]